MAIENAPRAAQPNPPILAAVDGSASSYQAVAWAAVEAALHRCALHIITSMAIPTGFGPGISLGEADLEWMRRDGERVLTEAERVARTATSGEEPSLTTEVSFELVIPLLIGRSAQARMLVVGSRGLGAFQRGLLGSVSTATTHHARCPVAVIHGISAIDAVSARQPVLVGVDGTDNSVPAVGLAFEEASRRKVDLVALHAWSDTSGLDVPVRGWDAARESAEALLAESLAGWSDRYPDVAVRRIVTADRPARSLLEESANAQLVVVGTHGRGGFMSTVLGSTSNALLHSVEVPMIVVRSR
ncbi:universal stress protein [Nocardia abscessus]|uniref:universal stress protein n=1 Tax=Nocardia TaxID=1817 RepID=UPI00189348BA|nr:MULTISPECIES: universal stress protein [Nocardia]MBF6223068.1 universal stress protein [Nocardia abscessus]MDE1673884.1 universal stress protein [Nocardia gipuzkoensis]